MNLLLDTHAFLWWDADWSRLSATALAACRDPANTLHFSLASAWEIQIKSQLGKLRLRQPLVDVLNHHVGQGSLTLITPVFADVWAIDQLPLLHRDPFDRMLVAQARRSGLHMVSGDAQIAQYNVPIVW